MLCKGIAAAQGIAIGHAFVKVEQTLSYTRTTLEADQVAAEVARLKEAVGKTISQLEAIKQKASKDIGEAEAKIFEAHQLIMSDPEFIGAIESNIESEKINSESALEGVSNMFVGMFESMEDEYMRERAADLRDVSKRLLKNLLGIEDSLLGDATEAVILVCHDLTPSDTAQLDKDQVKAFVTNIGGRTSHSAIMARTMEIPAVTGLSDITEKVKSGDMLVVDGETGDVFVNPDQDLIASYEQKLKEFHEQKATWAKLINEPSVTKDGHHVELVANIGTPHDAEGADKAGAEGIGLFRTEFLYMGRDNFPTEEEQFEAYKAVAATIDNNRPVVIRTLDIGGDKELPYLDLPHEMNPFLGYRAIRICLDQVDLFKTQLRALLRASAFGNIKIMYPMIASLVELRQANAILEEVKEDLRQNGIAFNEEIEVGMMIEIPAAAVVADQLAKEADFFSIGTNDLIQYTMAVDRMNQQISYLYDPFNPAVLRLIKNVIDAAHKEGKWAGMCGEMAGEEYALPVLLGFGLDEFSMSAPSILRSRHLLTQLSMEEMKAATNEILNLATGEEIRAYIKENILDKL